MGFVAIAVQPLLLRVLSPEGGADKVAQAGSLMGAIGAGMLAYALFAALLRAPELKEISRQVWLNSIGPALDSFLDRY